MASTTAAFEALGTPQEVRLASGTIRYRERGNGRPLLFVHGVLVNGGLWRKVVPSLAEHYRCIAPDWPLGAHTPPLDRSADLRPTGVAAIIAEFIDALGLDDVVVIANDTGGALCQILVTRHPERIGALVLTPCDAYENFLPRMFQYLRLVARIPGGLFLLVNTMRVRAVRRLPFAYGWLAHELDRDAWDAFLAPALGSRGVRRDVGKVLRGVSKRYTLDAAALLPGFDRPAMVAWGADDRFFPAEHGRLLAGAMPQGRFEDIAGSRTYVPEDQPARLAESIRRFLVTAESTAVRKNAS